MARSAWGGRPVPVQGAPTPVTGLWVACHPRGGWMLVHEGSGCIVGADYSDPEAALAAAIEVGPLADWTVATGTQMHLPGAVISQIDTIVQRWGASGIEIKRKAGQ